jgi:hypothetical protein
MDFIVFALNQGNGFWRVSYEHKRSAIAPLLLLLFAYPDPAVPLAIGPNKREEFSHTVR